MYGFYQANSVGDDIELYADESRTEVLTTVHSLRQQMEKPAGQFYHALADYIAPKESGRADYLGAFAVTIGASGVAAGTETADAGLALIERYAAAEHDRAATDLRSLLGVVGRADALRVERVRRASAVTCAPASLAS